MSSLEWIQIIQFKSSYVCTRKPLAKSINMYSKLVEKVACLV